ncbi:hypothetical protein BHE74_00013985 [Ensete ventricosum]|nr:hypothetical protein BHE74_00013985 [Ensete ventricosum]
MVGLLVIRTIRANPDSSRPQAYQRGAWSRRVGPTGPTQRGAWSRLVIRTIRSNPDSFHPLAYQLCARGKHVGPTGTGSEASHSGTVERRRDEDVVLVAASALGVGGGSGDPGRGGAPRRHPVWPRLG